MGKKILSLLIIINIFLSLFSSLTFASDFVKSGTCGTNATWTLDSDGVLTISGTGEMMTAYSDSIAVWRSPEVKKVVVEEGITLIGSFAFMNCENLEEVQFSSTVHGISESMFQGCTNLKSIVIPDGTIGIGENAFERCKNLRKVVIPDSVEMIGFGAFASCESLGSIVIPDSVYSIASFAFSGCKNLKDIKFGGNIEYIGMDAFDGTKWYKNQPDGLVIIDKVLYKYKGYLPENSEIEIPEGVVGIATSAFKKINNPKTIIIPSTFEYTQFAFTYGYGNIENVYYNGGENTFKVYFNEDDFVFKKAVTHIKYKYFSDTVKISKGENGVNIFVSDNDDFTGKNILCIFMKDNEIAEIQRGVFENGESEFDYESEFDEVRIIVYDNLISPSFDNYEKISAEGLKNEY